MRAEFLAAPFEERALSDAEPEDLGPVPFVAPRWGEGSDTAGREKERARPSRAPWMTLVAIAAIAAAALFVLRWPSAGGWRVAASSDFLLARVDGREFGPTETARLAAALASGSVVEVEGGALDLALDSRVALSLASGCTLTLVAIPDSEVLGDLWLDQQSGSLAVVTGPDFQGSSLRIQTADTEVRILGTQFSVDVIAGVGTCVCCSEGSVSVFDGPVTEDPIAEGRTEHTLPQGEMRFVFRDHRPMKTGPAMPEHLAPIESLRQVWSALR